MRPQSKTLVGALCLLAFSTPALADQLDGDWCFPSDGRNLNIQGDAIVTAHGTSTTGDYQRHTFSYTIPDSDPGAGGKIDIRQLNDETMILRQPDGSEETWKRCDLQTS